MTSHRRRRMAVIGAGPAGLIAAEMLVTGAHARDLQVTVYDHMPSVGRKLLMAGRGGLNLTHGEPRDAFLARYGEAGPYLAPLLDAFPPSALRTWCEGLGQATFVGSSGRVFPKAMKASPLLRAWLRRLEQAGVTIVTRQRWTGWDQAGRLIFATADGGKHTVAADATILAMGGASWPRLGADGGWVDAVRGRGIEVAPLLPSNCGFDVAWSEIFRSRFEGQPLKRIAIACAGQTVRGEAMVTAGGLEGGAVYALCAVVRRAIQANGSAQLSIDLWPDLSIDDLARRLARPRAKQSLATFLRKRLGLSPVQTGLLREVSPGARLPEPAADLARLIKACRVRVTGVSDLSRAISTAGGIAFSELDEHMMVRRMPGVFVAGEMLDWEAPTGGYLLQACFSSGVAAARGALAWLGQPAPSPPAVDW